MALKSFVFFCIKIIINKRCVYCTGTGIELQLPEVPATVLQRVKGSYRYRYHSYSTGDHFQLVVATGQRSNQHLRKFLLHWIYSFCAASSHGIYGGLG